MGTRKRRKSRVCTSCILSYVEHFCLVRKAAVDLCVGLFFVLDAPSASFFCWSVMTLLGCDCWSNDSNLIPDWKVNLI